MTDTLKIDWVFMNLLPPLSPDERAKLKKQIAEDGVLMPVIVWAEQNVLVDGHHRVEIAKELGIECPERRKSFPDRDAVAEYIIENQGARRNISKFDLEKRIGQYYKSVKQPHGGDRRSSRQSDDSIHERTTERVAKVFKTSPKTVERAAKFSDAVETLSALVPDIEQRLRDGNVSSREAIVKAAKVAKTKDEALALISGKTSSTPPKPKEKLSRSEAYSARVTWKAENESGPVLQSIAESSGRFVRRLAIVKSKVIVLTLAEEAVSETSKLMSLLRKKIREKKAVDAGAAVEEGDPAA